MASFEVYGNKVLKLEGGYVNHPNDKGGPTKYGVILSTWKQYGYDKDGDGDIDVDDLKVITEKDAKGVAKKIFWDYFQADKIHNQSLAEIIVDWGYASCRVNAAKKVQVILGVKADGIPGKETLKAINQQNASHLFEKIKEARKEHIERIVQVDPTQQVFYKGWMNRINSFFFFPSTASGDWHF
jgi:lysozyme family protein